MAGLFERSWEKFVDWLDLPPPKQKPGIADIHWEFLGDILGELVCLTDKETTVFAQTDFSSTAQIRKLVTQWILPAFERFTPTSQTRILHTIDFYLASGSPKLSWVFPSFGIPVNIQAHRLFAIIREMLPGIPIPKRFNSTLYRENTHQSFSNTLFSKWESQGGFYSGCPDNDGSKAFLPMPERTGLFLPCNLDRHQAKLDLSLFRTWCSTGLSPDGVQGLPMDAVRWRKGIDIEAMHNLGADRFMRQYNQPVGVKRLTMRFKQAVGEGYLAGEPDKLIEAFHVRFIIDRFGFLVRCHPLIRI